MVDNYIISYSIPYEFIGRWRLTRFETVNFDFGQVHRWLNVDLDRTVGHLDASVGAVQVVHARGGRQIVDKERTVFVVVDLQRHVHSFLVDQVHVQLA